MDIKTVNKEMVALSPQDIIKWTLDRADNPVVTTHFGPHEAAILHMVTQIRPDITVVWIDSGYATKATYQFADRLIRQLSLNIQIYHPKYSRSFREAVMGGIPEVDTAEHDEFTRQVKLEPFTKAMEDIRPDYWLTAIRKDQTDYRKGLDIITQTDGGMLRVAPQLHWSELDVEEYLIEHDLPIEDDYYDPTKVYEHRECGLHTSAVRRLSGLSK